MFEKRCRRRGLLISIFSMRSSSPVRNGSETSRATPRDRTGKLPARADLRHAPGLEFLLLHALGPDAAGPGPDRGGHPGLLELAGPWPGPPRLLRPSRLGGS